MRGGIPPSKFTSPNSPDLFPSSPLLLAPFAARLWRGVLVERVLSRARALPALLSRETPSPRALGRFSPAARKPSAPSPWSRDGDAFVAARGEGSASA